MIEILAVLSASASAGLRIALPLLVIGLLHGDSLWSRVPILSLIPPQVVLGVLVSWSLFELVAPKQLLGQRVQQLLQVVFSPLVGTIMGIAIAQTTLQQPTWMIWLVGAVGGILALVLQLVQAGWFYRLRGLPIWAIFLQDLLCVFLVLFAFDAPEQGGLIALLLLWLAIRSSKEWYRWYVEQSKPGDRSHPRRHKQNPD
ncbi:DUF4126 domain-containing protein [Roseofilum reptotaenium CS-1145]|uniref:DUF4126 domain-containing protein n=1 Tax=Roseofilum reptotaenium AO1-A TaxID=1925591 RepID=A0A1L9QPG7_9CYAN|nr:DUF4126 domain-containing protein [Roseofilum reptotaenium]MDB9519521.1 DUF4126 domain-containing protein [Roseofilum reptotaenium CS-1145]OJJ24526.1 DUF4126 domain-containing protein [Roseofilum reptotaenium AO1-A]